MTVVKIKEKHMNWDLTKEDNDLIDKIVARAVEKGSANEGRARLTLCMDLDAVHSNGCLINFQKLLDADIHDFEHDIIGIQNNINRETGHLENCFHPRFAVSQ